MDMSPLDSRCQELCCVLLVSGLITRHFHAVIQGQLCEYTIILQPNQQQAFLLMYDANVEGASESAVAHCYASNEELRHVAGRSDRHV